MLQMIKNIHQSSPQPYGILTPEGDIIWVNHEALASFPHLSPQQSIFLILGEVQTLLLKDAYEKSKPSLSLPSIYSKHLISLTRIDEGWLFCILQSPYQQTIPSLHPGKAPAFPLLSTIKQPVQMLLAEISNLYYSNTWENTDSIYPIFQQMNKNAYRLLRISCQVDLYHHLIKMGRSELDKHNFSLNIMLERLVQEIRYRSAEQINIELSFEEEVFLFAQEDLIEMSILEILLNALLALPQENPLLQIKLYAKQNKAILAIEDNGFGIEGDILSLFHPFYTSTLPSAQTGIGLGIPNAYLSLLLHGGSLLYEPQNENGTRAILTLPISKIANPILKSSPPLNSRFSQTTVIFSDLFTPPSP